MEIEPDSSLAVAGQIQQYPGTNRAHQMDSIHLKSFRQVYLHIFLANSLKSLWPSPCRAGCEQDEHRCESGGLTGYTYLGGKGSPCHKARLEERGRYWSMGVSKTGQFSTHPSSQKHCEGNFVYLSQIIAVSRKVMIWA